LRIGVLALQGAFIEHRHKLTSMGVETFEIRQLKDLDQPMDGLILPGGESTTQGRLLVELGLFAPLKKKIEQAQLKVLKTKTVNQAFTETEISLIQLLINANGAKQNVEISEINRVLGIKDKNVGLQKKVRSDVINAINDKYVFITQGENNLIASVRKEDDKRFYEYFVVPTEVKTVQKLIEKN